MNRKRLNIVPQASMFPFLGVLACVVGMLALMIGMLAPTQAEGRKVALSEDEVKKLDEMQEQIAFADIDIKRLTQRRDEAEDIHTRLEKSDAELHKLQERQRAEQERIRNTAELMSRLRSESDSLTKELGQLEPELNELNAKKAELQARLDERLKPPPDPVTRISRYVSTRGIEPVFAECRPDSLAIFESDEPLIVPAADLQTNPEYLALLERVAGIPNGAVIFLIRSDAVETYIAARNVARQKSCRNGKLPIVGQGPIDLSLVQGQFEKEPEE